MNRSGRILAWLPVPLFILALVIFSAGDRVTTYGSPLVLISVNLAFASLTSFVVFTLASRSFLLRGTPDLLFVGCGALVWGCTSLISIAADPGDPNITVTIYNCGTFLAGLCHLTGSLLTGRVKPARRALGFLLTAASVASLAILFCVVFATLEHWMPVFFVQGQGGTNLRRYVLICTAFCFGLTGVVLRLLHRKRMSSFARWYSIAVTLIAIGTIGVMLPSSLGSILNWTARAAQYLGGFYMLAAAVISAREATDWELSLTDELSQTKHRYENLFHLAVDGIAIHELSDSAWFGRILEANPALCEMLGYSESELRTTDSVAVASTPSARTSGPDSGALVLRREIKLQRKDGTILLAEVNTRVFRENERDLAMSIVRDITARKTAEEHLRELAVRLSYHVENTPLAVIEWGADMRLTRWSSGAERLFGWSAAEVLGKRMEDFRWIVSDDQPLVSNVTADLQSGRTHGFSAHRNYRKDGTIVHCQWYNSSLLAEDGNLRSILSLVLDVSARTEAEAGLRSLNAELEQFAYAVSHDLQEPLRNIIIFSDLIGRRHGASLSKEAVHDLGFVVTGAKQINNLLTGLRSYLQITKEAAAPENADPASVLKEVIGSLDAVITRENAVVAGGDMPPVAVSTVHLHQLFQNLISNALKFRSKERPTVTITAHRSGSIVRFAVSDNGIGIEPRYASQIFGVFRRLHGRDRYEGSGIGLAICHKIVARYGGEIWVESEAGRGATFFFTLPVAASTQGDTHLEITRQIGG